MDLKKLQSRINLQFESEDLLKEALTHRSYINENPSWPFKNNERLEFLGDAVLELVITEELFKHLPKKEEGELTMHRAALVNAKMLGKIARNIGLDEEVLVSKGETKEILNGNGETILADGIEALIGALYLDGGYDAAQKFIRTFILQELDSVIKAGVKDAKSLIQEMVQSEHGFTPTYRVIEESGPAHQKVFKVGLYVGEELRSSGTGNSKQNAELVAAEKLVSKLKAKSII